jgi:hypothetical protein
VCVCVCVCVCYDQLFYTARHALYFVVPLPDSPLHAGATLPPLRAIFDPRLSAALALLPVLLVLARVLLRPRPRSPAALFAVLLCVVGSCAACCACVVLCGS